MRNIYFVPCLWLSFTLATAQVGAQTLTPKQILYLTTTGHNDFETYVLSKGFIYFKHAYKEEESTFVYLNETNNDRSLTDIFQKIDKYEVTVSLGSLNKSWYLKTKKDLELLGFVYSYEGEDLRLNAPFLLYLKKGFWARLYMIPLNDEKNTLVYRLEIERKLK